MPETELTNWGNYPRVKATVIAAADCATTGSSLPHGRPVIARGAGRCYGDSALQRDVISTRKWNRFLAFDKEPGLLQCESGVLLSEILDVIVPCGFFLPVTPGTKYITIGGAVASNVHGKNHHHDGAFGSWVRGLEIMTGDGVIHNCSATENAGLFCATIGGMGLTGIITTVTISLVKIETAFIRRRNIKAHDLDELMDLFERHRDWRYAVAWLDCTRSSSSSGRGVLSLGEHATQSGLQVATAPKPAVPRPARLDIPCYFPAFTLNKFSIGLLNFFRFHTQSRESNSVVHYDSFFYPLDKLRHWNRLYGRGGFLQYQFVLPLQSAREGLRKITGEIAISAARPTLAVLKLMGKSEACASPLSFPMEGYSLALDFKVNKVVFALLDRLDALVVAYGGRVYLAKDARMSSNTFNAMYHTGRANVPFASLQSERLAGNRQTHAGNHD